MNIKDLYPTSEEVINTMIAGLNFEDKYAMDPSAGTGNITNLLEKLGAKVLFCEINDKLIGMNRGRFLKNDFLKVTKEEVSHLDYIIMNPPFSADEKHILHAFEIAPAGCEIRALCNYQTIANQYSHDRKNLSYIISQNGRVENIGKAFETSERKTDVEVGFITLFKPKEENNEFEGYFDYAEEEQGQESGLIRHNEMRELVGRYIQAVQMFDSVNKASNEINEITSYFNFFDIKFGAKSKHYEITRDIFKKELQKTAWNTVFSKMNMEKYVTQKVLEKMNKFVETQENVPFTVKNIYKMIDIIAGTYEQNMNQALLDIFDRITARHNGNREYLEGWKTNNQYFINNKFIMPFYCNDKYYSCPTYHHYYSNNNNIITDLVKGLCFLSGKNYNDMVHIREFLQGKNETGKVLQFGKWYEFNFFTVKFYKKDTIHVKFNDTELCKLFNLRVAKLKGWRLPSRTGSDFRRRKEEVTIY